VDFYQVLANFYDEIFPLKAVHKEFLRSYLAREQIKSVLDVGCATGSYVLELNDWGIETAGIDLSPDMIEIARDKGRQRKSQAEFLLKDMRDLSEVSGTFDGILCLGNTLAHLTEEPHLLQALKQFGVKGRHLLLQLVNYDRVLEQQVTELPEIRTSRLVFQRRYELLDNGLIRFSMELELLAEGIKTQASNLLVPLTKDKLESFFRAARWESQSWWGSYAAEEWSTNTQATIVSASFSDSN